MTELSPAETAARLAKIVGEKYVLAAPRDMEAFMTEPRDLWHGKAACVVRPGSTEEVAAICAFADENGLKVVPQGGNTGLVGGQIPDQSGKEILLSLGRLDKIREIDPESNTMIVEAGVTLQKVQEAAESVDRLFPLSLASEGSCTIGGNLASNAGGTAVLAYGNARDLVTGLEVVLADGSVLGNLSKLRKDNTGYDLKHVFMGSEGTLGIITAAVVKLYPRPRAVETALIGLASAEKCLELLVLAQGTAGPDLKTFEFMSRFGVEIVVRHSAGAREPLESPHAWYVLLELASQSETGLNDKLMALLEAAFEKEIIEDAAVAASLDQRKAFWALRENLSEMQKLEGGSIKHDVCVPVASVPAFLAEAVPVVEKTIPGARPVPFGHMGDGNIHFNVSQPIGADKAAYLARWEELNEAVHAVVKRMNGSISAEHGIGVLKRELLPTVKDPVAMNVMRRFKTALDPRNTLNPGKVL
ncbi:FAD-binding oxidoreductase [Rhodoblastus acidophilus]|uniref:FAD-binding oxidoreductase n=1 Tax=Candidatus Rhodoblastus alkanivorans TaxID=2954117 RepID=A0ABS9Z4N7_9HYPH|nr:FAD-binding oxidoreductase [Candidatus Rhodoblastus alkanivorans]MCI4677674.1 FAD-binding oxidoreductase [Candidatus Rhodoblastus alkanivorans]MCI4682594.1 FAD-binding oxidoreductase [Candidatus Rhodoblastus alkanivorans]MDI4639900.1 FAD-binding oxidoreductase [Rhodoblastus acidophilus]